MSMVIVQGAFVLRPEERDRFLQVSSAGIRSSRQEEGCLEYVMAADPIDAGRVILSERWESNEHLEQHLKNARSQSGNAGSSPGERPIPISHEIMVYEIAAFRPLG